MIILEKGVTLEEREIDGFKCLFLNGEIRYIRGFNLLISENDLEIYARIFKKAKIGEVGERKIREDERIKTINMIKEHIEMLKSVSIKIY